MNPSCTTTREVAAELALGIAEGQRRAEALEHLMTCGACRAEVDHLTATADDLLLIAPSEEPPAGFETAVLGRLDPPATARSTRWSRRRVVLTAAAAVLVVALVFALGLGVGARWDRAEETATGVAVGTFTTSSGQDVGEVTVHSGEPSWLVVTFADASNGLPPGNYIVECENDRGYTYTAGTFTVDAAEPISSWSTKVDYRLDSLRHVRLIDAADGEAVEATVAPA